MQQLEEQREWDPRANILLIQLYEQIIERVQTDETPIFYGVIQTKLGNAYRALPTGDQMRNLAQAIGCFQRALRFLTPETAPLDYATTQNALGMAYSELLTGDQMRNLAQAIACYQQALRIWTPETAPLDYARTQNNLGVAYSDLPTGDQMRNLAQAIACYQQALRFQTPETAPLDYARTQNNLGIAYADLPTGDRAANQEQAIACYQRALRFLTPETDPLGYAMTQNNLGGAYHKLPTGDRASNMAQAIGCYQQALHFLTLETAPQNYAMLQTNLGNAYYNLPTGDHTANLEQAIRCFQQALRFRTPETAPLDYAMTQHNLGNAYQQLSTGDHAANLKQAIRCYQEALRFWTPETAPLDYAKTQSTLGSVYAKLTTGDRAANLEQALHCFQQALRFQTPETAPQNYATTQTNLGTVYSELPTGDYAANVEQAIGCYQEALRVWKAESAPWECRAANRNLADLYFAQREWQAAFDAYSASIDAGEQLYLAGLSAESKVTEMAENADLYRHAAFAAARCGKNNQALLILEQGKTRLLAEALRLRVPRPANIPDEAWTAFEKAGATVQAVQDGGITKLGETRDPVQAYEALVQKARAANAALDAAIEQVRIHASEFLQPISLQVIQPLLSDRSTALVAFCITEQGSIGFTMNQYDQEVQVIEVPTFTQKDLSRLFIDGYTDGRLIGGWLVAYGRYLIDRTITALEAWQGTITRVLAELGERLLTPLVSALPAGVERIILLPSAELFLFPLHAVPLDGNLSELLCDRYQVSYAPSIEVLVDARAKVRQGVVPKLYAAINPQEDPNLVFTLIEGVAIAQFFAQQIVDVGRIGTKARVLIGVQGRTYVHFACHGSYVWSDPPASGLDLANDRLTLAELQRGTVDLSAARLVTLSTCETGITDVLGGRAEEYVGIPAGFLLAGVPCVVSSLWVVPDFSTSLLMERFYRNHLKEGMDFAKALREAQWWVRELGVVEVAQNAELWFRQAVQKDKKREFFKLMRYYRYQAEQNPNLHPFAHPYYWAAFTVNGM